MLYLNLQIKQITSFGMRAAKELTAKDDKAPRPTNVFIFGAPLRRLLRPSTISWRPGPSNVKIDKEIWNPVECNAWIHAALAPKKWETWPKMHTAQRAQETTSPRPVNRQIFRHVMCQHIGIKCVCNKIFRSQANKLRISNFPEEANQKPDKIKLNSY